MTEYDRWTKMTTFVYVWSRAFQNYTLVMVTGDVDSPENRKHIQDYLRRSCKDDDTSDASNGGR